MDLSRCAGKCLAGGGGDQSEKSFTVKTSGIHRPYLDNVLILFRIGVSTLGSLEVDGVFISSCETAEKYCSAG